MISNFLKCELFFTKVLMNFTCKCQSNTVTENENENEDEMPPVNDNAVIRYSNESKSNHDLITYFPSVESQVYKIRLNLQYFKHNFQLHHKFKILFEFKDNDYNLSKDVVSNIVELTEADPAFDQLLAILG